MKNNWATSWDTSNKMCPNSAKICSQPHLHLFLRNNVYYVRYELEKIDGKRRFKKISLHTSNYHEALQMIKDMDKYIRKINQLSCLYRQLKIEKRYDKNNNSTVPFDYVVGIDDNLEVIKQIKSLYDECCQNDIDNDLETYKNAIKSQIVGRRDNFKMNNIDSINDFHPLNQNEQAMWRCCLKDVGHIQDVLEKVGQIIVQIQQTLYPQEILPSLNQISSQTSPVQSNPIAQPSVLQSPAMQTSLKPHHTIQEVIEQMKLDQNDKANKDTFGRKLRKIKVLLSEIGVTLNDDYDKLNNQKVINKIEANILKRSELTAKTKNAWILSVNEVIENANKLEPDYYNIFQIKRRNENSNVEKIHKKEYLPFSKDELIKMFNPEEKFFKKYPDIFYSVLIAIFCGGRTNGTSTLRYTDITDQDGIKCFDFKLDDDDENPGEDIFKKLKNSSTVRTVPIHSRLIELGFLQYIYKYQERNEHKFQNFIFKRTISIKKETKEQVYNTHFFRPFFNYLRKIGIKKDRWKAFHSFRNTISNFLDDCGVSDLLAKKIVGWKGNDTRFKHYSTRELKDIQRELEKLKYPFLDKSLEQIANEILEKEDKIKEK